MRGALGRLETQNSGHHVLSPQPRPRPRLRLAGGPGRLEKLKGVFLGDGSNIVEW